MILASSSPTVGILALLFLFIVSASVILAVKYVRKLIEDVIYIKEHSDAEQKPKKRKNGNITVNPKDIKSISFKDDVA